MRLPIYKLVLFCIIILAAILRFYHLGAVPPSLNADEAAIGYNAYSILKTGKDEYGEFFPLAFRSFDDYKAPLYIYLTSISIALFGLNDFAIRFFSAFLGVFTILGTYFLVKEIDWFKSRWLPLLSALLLAISPWHLHFSRAAYEANSAVCFVVFGLWLYLKGLRNGKYLPVSALIFTLSLWTYHAPRIFIPLFVLGISIITWKELVKQGRWVCLALIIGLFVSFPIIRIMISSEGQIRAKGVSAYYDIPFLDRSLRWINDDIKNKQVFPNLVHNRRIEYARIFLKGYFAHFSPSFWFLEEAEAKYRAPGIGMMHLFELPFFLLGFYVLASWKGKFKWILFLWFILAPVAAAPTLRVPHPVRAILFLPVLQIFTAFGIWKAILQIRENFNKYTRFEKQILSGLTISIIAFSLANVYYYFHQYYWHLPKDYAADWQWGRKEVVNQIRKLGKDYDRIVVSTSLDQPHIFFLYYLGIDPLSYLAQGGTKSGSFDTQNNSFDKYLFKKNAEYQPLPGEKVLYAGDPFEVKDNTLVIDTITYPDGKKAFILFKNLPLLSD